MDTSTQVLLGLAALACVATLAFAVVLVIRLFRARRLLRDAGIPVQNKLAFWGALIYTISPVDLIPDPVYLDDIGVLLLALHTLQAAARRRPGTLGTERL
ncbi:YkvA family protein [Streptomyces sp. NBC_01465]|uniref:YkvA family protein n=1 Tax=Streptomyces sp. NBC_01465 TaxID=2903878 RepID=UPI002E318FBC|nr:YkvA family protein [Streptomyces sp. NBC_01465]